MRVAHREVAGHLLMGGQGRRRDKAESRRFGFSSYDE